MKKNLIITTLVVALVLCLSFGTFAATDPIHQYPTADEPNEYTITSALQDFAATNDLFIGTSKAWKEAGGKVDTKASENYSVFNNGEAISKNDIVIANGKVGVVLAVGTRNPWGYPAGSVLDAGSFTQGETALTSTPNRDMTWSIETLINDWDAWGPANCGNVTFDVVKYNFTTKVEAATGAKEDVILDAVKVSRVYNLNDVKFDVVSYYGIAADEDFVYSYDYLKNTSGKALSSNGDDWTIGNAFCITNKGDDGGAMYDLYANGTNPAVGSYGIATGGNPYSVSVVVPGKNVTSAGTERPINNRYGAVGYKGLYSFADWKADESVTYDKYIVISNEPTTQAATDFINDYNKLDTTTISGSVKDADGKALAADKNATIVVKQDGNVYTWAAVGKDGTYKVNVPKGDSKAYTVAVEATGYAPSEDVAAANKDAAVTVDLTAGAAKDAITINLKDKNEQDLWGKVEFLNEYPTVRYTGDSIYQCEVKKDGSGKGVINAYVDDITDFDATVFGQGYYFFSDTVAIDENDVKDGVVDVTIDMQYALPGGWLAADLHHHANKNDAFADPKEAIPSMLASGLDVAFVSDHDFTVNNAEGKTLAEQGGMAGFIPSEEISCSWAHFNVLVQNAKAYDKFLDTDKKNYVMNQFAQFKTFVEQTHDNNATITANHPWYSYGLFYSNAADAVPGGYVDDYDTIEINSCCQDKENVKTINSVTDMWGAYATDGTLEGYADVEKAHYLVGGSDTHDVLYPGVANNKGHTSYITYATGKIRTVAEAETVDNDVKATALNYTDAVANGNSYVTLGPILDLSKTPGGENGEEVVYQDKFDISIDIDSLSGIKDVVVLSNFGDKTYTYAGMDKKGKTPTNYTIDNVYRVYSADQLNGSENSASLNFRADVPAGQSGYFAFMVVDKNDFGMFALTNPYWVEANGTPFPDVDMKAWYGPYVEALYQAGMIKGKPDGTFAPTANVTRAEFCSMLFSNIGIDEEALASAKLEMPGFPDVIKGSWYYDSVMLAANLGIVVGDEKGYFNPNDNISRAEVAQIIYKFYDITERELPVVKPDITFKDVKDGVWYTDAVMALAKADLIKGIGNDLFAPAGLASRAEACTFIYRGLLADGDVILNSLEALN